ncbi:12731_t:CDS:2, partial [Gigaspora margarita]
DTKLEDTELEDPGLEDINESMTFSSINNFDIKQLTKILYVTHRSRKFACPCAFNVICGHDCQDIIAVRLFINKSGLQNSNFNSYGKSGESNESRLQR